MSVLLLALLLQDDFADAIKKSQSLKSYRFKTVFESEGGQNATPASELEGWFDAEKGLYFKSAQGEAFKKGKKTAIRPNDQEWSSIEEWLKENPAGAGGAAIVKGFKPPHEGLKSADKRLEKVEKAGDKEKVGDEECVVWSGPLNEDAAETTFVFKGMLGFVEERKLKATMKVWVDSEGRVRKWTMKHELTGTAGGNEVDVKVTWTVTIEKHDGAEAEVPEGAAKAIGE